MGPHPPFASHWTMDGTLARPVHFHVPCFPGPLLLSMGLLASSVTRKLEGAVKVEGPAVTGSYSTRILSPIPR
jgi:hypothetical protein